MNRLVSYSRKIMKIIVYPIKFIIPLLLIMFFYVSIEQVVQEEFGLYSLDKGKIITHVDDFFGENRTSIDYKIMGLNNKIVFGSIPLNLEVNEGDTVEYKNFRNRKIIVYKLNGKQFLDLENWIDYVYPFILLILGWVYYKIVIQSFYNKHFRKKTIISNT